jgi:hypothetical protein
VNSKIGDFGIQTGPIPLVFTEFWKIRPVFLTLARGNDDVDNKTSDEITRKMGNRINKATTHT